jgi:hypothetical protein
MGSGLQKNVFRVLQFVLSVGMRLEGLDANTLNIVMSAERVWTKMSDYLIDFHLAIEAMSRISDSICEAEAVDALCEVPTIELIRCKDCEDCTETKLYDGQRWNYCMRLRCVVKENDFCCWAERKYPKIKAKVTE